MDLLGRWVTPEGRLVRIEQFEAGKATGRWAGSKNGVAGFQGRIFDNNTKIKGMWFDEAILGEFPISITLSSEKDSFTAVSNEGKPGSYTQKEWSAQRVKLSREGGKLADWAARDKKVFDRLTAAADKAAWAEESRQALLKKTMEEAGHMISRDGATTYIPPLTIGEPFGDAAARKAQEDSRTKGKQLAVPRKAADRPAVATWMKDEYEDRFTLSRRLRKEAKARHAASVPAEMRERKPFRGTDNTVGMHSNQDDVFLSPVDGSMSKEQLAKVAEEMKRLQLEQAAAAAGGANMITPHLLKKETKLEVLLGPKNIKVGHAAWTEKAAKPLPYMSEDYQAKKLADRAALMEEIKKRGEKPFKPSGPISKRPWEVKEDPPAAPPAEAAGGAGTGADEGKKDERPPYKPYTKDLARFVPLKHWPYLSEGSGPEKGKKEEGKEEEKMPWKSPTPHTSRAVMTVALHPVNLHKLMAQSGGFSASGLVSPLASPQRPGAAGGAGAFSPPASPAPVSHTAGGAGAS